MVNYLDEYKISFAMEAIDEEDKKRIIKFKIGDEIETVDIDIECEDLKSYFFLSELDIETLISFLQNAKKIIKQNR